MVEVHFNRRSKSGKRRTVLETISYIIMRYLRQKRHRIRQRRFKWKMCSIADSIMTIMASPPCQGIILI